MNVEIGAEAALFPEKEYIGIFVAVYCTASIATFQRPYKNISGLGFFLTKGSLRHADTSQHHVNT
jgi:hypothetical protein